MAPSKRDRAPATDAPRRASAAQRQRPRRVVEGPLARVGDTPGRRAQWLLQFGMSDPARLSPGQWLDLRTELVAFAHTQAAMREAFTWGPVRVLGADWQHLVPATEPDTKAAHAWLHDGLTKLLNGERWTIETRRMRYLQVGNPLTYGVLHSDVDTFRLAAEEALLAVWHKLHVCPVCRQKLFVARKRQGYCSSRCSQTFRTRRFRAKRRSQGNTRRRRR